MNILQYLQSLNKNKKKLILLLNDFCLIIFSVYISIALRIDTLNIDLVFYKYAFILIPIVIIPVLSFFGIYKVVVRYIGFEHIKTIFYSTITYSIILILIFLLFNLAPIPRSIAILQPIVFIVAITVNRIFLVYLLTTNLPAPTRINCLLYGAGQAGIDTFKTLKNSKLYEIVGFIDDDELKHNRYIDEVKVISFNSLEKTIKTKSVNEIILTMPNLETNKRKDLIEKLIKFNIRIRSISNLNDIINRKKSLFEINELEMNDFLNRKISFNENEIKNLCKDKVILVTGAGGSIGSELSRQINSLEPKSLILIDHSEINLYLIYNELKKIRKKTKIISLLSNINDVARLDNIFENYQPDHVYHAAAYKHVNIVQENVIDGIKNNVFGTKNLIDISYKYKVKKFTLISTDKAVDPSNVMGLTKRVCEIYLKSMKESFIEINSESYAVRFGNVLGSSGSVFKLFADQIKLGGPITVTHPDVTRYFMTIPESVGLILLSSSFKSCGNIYILEMGEPIKILDLAKRMIALSGLSIKNEQNPIGDIEIIFTGLTEGEKLHEKLSYVEKLSPTQNKNILVAIEEEAKYPNLKEDLMFLEESIMKNDDITSLEILKKIGNYK